MSNEPMMDVTSDDKLWAALGYPIGLIAIIVLFMDDKKARPFIKFHAVQSIAANIALWIVASILSAVTFGFGALCLFPLVVVALIYWAYKAYQGESFEIPVVTNFIKGQGWV